RKAHKPNDLTLAINSQGFTADSIRRHWEWLHARGARPDEGLEDPCCPGGWVGEADDDAVVVDGRGSVPGIAAEVTEVHRNSILPEEGVRCAHAANSHAAGAGDAHHLAQIVDSRGRAGGITGQR